MPSLLLRHLVCFWTSVRIRHIFVMGFRSKIFLTKHYALKTCNFFLSSSDLIFFNVCIFKLLFCFCSSSNVVFLLLQTRAEQSQGAYFLPEFALSPQGSFLEDTTGEQFLTYRYDDQVSMLYVKMTATFMKLTHGLV